LLENIATYLTAQAQIGGASGWSHAIGYLPDSPDKIVGLFQFAGRYPDPRAGLERPGVQVRVRASAGDYATAQSKAYSLFDGLQALPPGTITAVRYLHAIGSPTPLGQDDSRRPEFVLNFEAGVAR